MNESENAMRKVASCLLKDFLCIKPDERALLIYDETTSDIADAFIDSARALSINLYPRRINLTGRHGADPDPETIAVIPGFQVVIAPTYYSLTHCAAFTNAKKQGLRGATLPGINNELFIQSYSSPDVLEHNGKTIIRELTGHHEVEILSKEGTSLRFTTGRSPLVYETGIRNSPGDIGNIPFGEAFTAPDLGTAEGRIVVDGSIGSFDDWTPDSEPAIIDVKQGKAIAFHGKRAEALKKVLDTVGESAFVVAELGIGTNPDMKLTGNLLGDEKIKETVHIAFGNNKSFGGENESTVHIDVMILKPTLIVDNKILIQDGKWSM